MHALSLRTTFDTSNMRLQLHLCGKLTKGQQHGIEIKIQHLESENPQ